VESLSDLDETGRNSRRKNIRKLIRLIKAGKIDTLVIYSLDRLYRNVESFAKFLGLLRQYNVRLISISENFDTETPWGRLVMFVLAAMAEMFVRQTSVRTRSAIKARMQKGLPSGAYRFGYCNGLCSNCTDPNGPGYCPFVGETDQGDGRILIPHPIESHAVRLIVSLYSQGMSDKDIAEYLNSHTFEIHHGISS
jgi:DNA invertase Pin-like site-specific DNA recombinase